MQGVTAKTNTRASPVGEGTLTLVVELESYLSQPGTALDRSRVVIVQGDIVHAVELNDQLATLTAETERSVAVTTTLG